MSVGQYVYKEILTSLWTSKPARRTFAERFFIKVLQNLFYLIRTRSVSKNKRLTIEALIRVVPPTNKPGQWIPKGKISAPSWFNKLPQVRN